MTTFLTVVHWIAALIVLAEALNKLERTDIFNGATMSVRLRGLAFVLAPWRWSRGNVITALKLTGWAFLAIGAAGVLVNPLLKFDEPAVHDVAFVAGFAVLILRSRLKEESWRARR